MCLVAGTCVGGGMLALPVATSFSGFIPSLLMMAVCCAFMMATGLLFVEANVWMGPGAHIITMSRRLLGRWGEVVAGLLYCFIGYLSLVAYTAGGGMLSVGGLEAIFGVEVTQWVAYLLFALVFGVIIACGNRVVGRINAVLVVALIVTYLILLFGGVGEVRGPLLLRRNWLQGFYALPLLLTIFSYQAVVPSLVLYMDGDAVRLRRAIVGGTVLAFCIYALWQLLILGVVPLEGEHGLVEALREGRSATESFRYFAAKRWVATTGEFFAFFAIITSFLGVGLGLYDFLADALKVTRKGWNHVYLTLIAVGPSFLIAISYQRAFIEALDASGGFGDAILNGVIPAMMVWSGRYLKGYKGQVMVRGGKLALIVIILFALFVFGVEIAERFHVMVPMNDLR
jgi:tyrosine-specific transport protein